MNNRFTNSLIPQIRLYYVPDDTYPVIGTVRFRITTTSDITIWHDPKTTGTKPSKYNAIYNAALETKIELEKKGAASSDVRIFYHMIPSADGTLVRERFEWKHSGGPEVEALATENLPGENITQEIRGLKLVRASTGEMLAVFCGGKHQRVLNPKRVAGKLRFMGPNILEPLVDVMSVLSIIERSHRNAVYAAQGNPPCVII